MSVLIFQAGIKWAKGGGVKYLEDINKMWMKHKSQESSELLIKTGLSPLNAVWYCGKSRQDTVRRPSMDIWHTDI